MPKSTKEIIDSQKQEISALRRQLQVYMEKDKEVDTFKSILSLLPGHVYWKNLDGVIMGCNAAMAKVAGLASPLDIVGKTDFDLPWKEKAEDIRKIDLQVMNTKQPILAEESGLMNNHEQKIFLSRKEPLLNQDGKVIGMVGISLDITAQKQAEIAKTEFLENMSHDLRTPFSGILSLTEYLYAKEEEPGKKELLGDIKSSGKRLLALLNQILELARQGSHPIELKDFNLSEAIQEVIDLVHAEARHKGLAIKVLCPEITVNSDRIRFSRILLNLLGNAIKYTEKGTISIKSEQNPLRIMVEDTGEGIPANALETIFARFSKLHPSYKQQHYDGAGIGLHIAREYARELGGDITVTSEIGKGSCFTLLMKK